VVVVVNHRLFLEEVREMIDTQTETLIPINEASGHVPGSKPHLATIWRWVQRGVRNVKLDTVLVGGKRYTSAEAIARFVEQTNAAADGPQPKRGIRSRARQRAIERAEREFGGANA
jgi:hypothetical protein